MSKNILIIGGSSDTGKFLIKKFLKKKCKIFTTFNKNNYQHKYVKSFYVNFSDTESVNLFINKILNLKIKFNNVFFLQAELLGVRLDKYDYQKILNNFKINFISMALIFNGISSKLSNNCLTIFISSISGQKGSYDPIYSSSKSAVIGFSKSLATWSAPKHRFICVCPGPIIGTKLFNSFPKKRKEFHINTNPNKELLNLQDFSEILIDLTKPHWRHANGSIISINGGVCS
jgi:NAD(P)-dependent dehydrogenase (short-subunit alcohol dehydrogenase family)